MSSTTVPRRARAVFRLRPRVSLSLALACSLSVAAIDPAQAQESVKHGAEHCFAGISPSAMARVPVYLEASVADSASRVILPAADSLTLMVAGVIRSSFEHSVDSLPWGEPLVSWRRLGSSMYVTAYPDGSFNWAEPPNADSLYEPSRTMITQVLELTRAAGQRIQWPRESHADSLTFRIRFRTQELNQRLEPVPLRARYAVPVFSMTMPWTTDVEAVRRPRMSYPPGALARSIEGTVILEFVVDTTGRAVPGSVEEQWPEGKPRLTGRMAREYDTFLRSAIRNIDETEFSPGQVGGCLVSQVVQQPFHFEIHQ